MSVSITSSSSSFVLARFHQFCSFSRLPVFCISSSLHSTIWPSSLGTFASLDVGQFRLSNSLLIWPLYLFFSLSLSLSRHLANFTFIFIFFAFGRLISFERLEPILSDCQSCCPSLVKFSQFSFSFILFFNFSPSLSILPFLGRFTSYRFESYSGRSVFNLFHVRLSTWFVSIDSRPFRLTRLSRTLPSDLTLATCSFVTTHSFSLSLSSHLFGRSVSFWVFDFCISIQPPFDNSSIGRQQSPSTSLFRSLLSFAFDVIWTFFIWQFRPLHFIPLCSGALLLLLLHLFFLHLLLICIALFAAHLAP